MFLTNAVNYNYIGLDGIMIWQTHRPQMFAVNIINDLIDDQVIFKLFTIEFFPFNGIES